MGDVQREAQERAADIDADRHQFIHQMHIEGFRDWLDERPKCETVECARFVWRERAIVKVSEMHPATNIAGLYWRDNVDG